MTPVRTEQLTTERGHTVAVTRHKTYRAALMSMSAVQRKVYKATVWALPGGGYDLFPAGHPVPAGARRATP